jgi:hypothetical protein
MRYAVGAVFATLGLVAIGPAPTASAEELPDCLIDADLPQTVTNGIRHQIVGAAYRLECGQRRNITVRIREDIPILSDKTKASRSWTNVVNGTFYVVWDCDAGENGTYFTEILTSAGGKAKSAYAPLTCGDP